MWVGHEDHIYIGLPRFDHKGTAANALARCMLDPVLLPILLYNLLVEWVKKRCGQGRQKIRCLLLQCYLQRLVVDSLDSRQHFALATEHCVSTNNGSLEEGGNWRVYGW